MALPRGADEGPHPTPLLGCRHRADEAGLAVEPPGREADPTPSQDAVANEELELLEQSFARLPERYREVVGLAYVDRKSHAEIADELGISVGNSRVLLARALAALARLGVDLR